MRVSTEKGGNHLTSDPNMVYATVAQIAATFVSILGGFLLTLGLARIAEKHRLELSFERQKRIVEEEKRMMKENANYMIKRRRNARMSCYPFGYERFEENWIYRERL